MPMPGQLMFARGLSPTSRLIFWLVISFSLAIMDVRLGALDMLRAGISGALQPVQRVVLIPFDVAGEVSGFLLRHREMQLERDRLLDERTRLNQALFASRDLQRANTELSSLLGLARSYTHATVAANILYQGQDWFSRRITIDRGTSSGLRAGLPVVDAQGLVGQLTRVFPGSSEVTLINNTDQLTPVFIQRTGQRVLASGSNGTDQLELKFMPTHGDIKPGDILLTSGLDKVYPPGLPVATVIRVTRPDSSPYARVECVPVAGANRDRILLVIPVPAASPKP